MITVHSLSAREYVALLGSAHAIDDLASTSGQIIVVRGGMDTPIPDSAVQAAAVLTCVVIAVEAIHRSAPLHAVSDVTVTPKALDPLVSRIVANPQAAVALALLMRGQERRSVAEGLIAESSTYSLLQAGAEFARWRAEHPARQSSDAREHASVLASREDATLRLSLNRPAVRNALSAEMRDELFEALMVAAADDSLQIVLDGRGKSFCSGGDLNEFGSRDDPATAHIVRLGRSLGWVLHTLSPRTTVYVHGTCAGSGVELPAFAGRVVSHPDATFALPEVQLGLIPGAGGTVSVARRIGRQRCTLLALSGETISARTARSWGLIDIIKAFPVLP